MQRKMRMRVSLLEDYAEKLYAQKSGTKESEMNFLKSRTIKLEDCLEMRTLSKRFMELTPILTIFCLIPCQRS